MANKWTVAPETVRLDLKDPLDQEQFWVAVKKHLTIGETKTVQTAGLKSLSGIDRSSVDREMSMNIDWKRQSLARTLMYVVDWSLADEKGVKLKVTMDDIESLRPELYEVIENGITAHIEAIEAEKKLKAGA